MDQPPNEVLTGQPSAFLDSLDAAMKNKVLYTVLAFLSEARMQHREDPAVLTGLATMERSCIDTIRETAKPVTGRTNFLSGPPEGAK